MVRNITSEWPPPPSISISICSTEGLLVGEVAIQGRGHFWSERDNSLQMSWLVLRNAWFDFKMSKDPRSQNNLSQIKYSSISQDTWLSFLLSTYSMLLETHVGLIFKKYFQVLWVTLSAKQLKHWPADQLHWNICSKILSRAQMRSSGLVHSGGASTSEEYGVTFSTPEAHHCLTKLQCMPVMTPHLLTSKARCTNTASGKLSKFKDFMQRVNTVFVSIQ